MVSKADYRREGVPTRLLGCGYNSWQKVHLRTVLDHYGHQYKSRVSKLELMRELDVLIQQRGIDRDDKRRILETFGRGQILPPQQPVPARLGSVQGVPAQAVPTTQVAPAQPVSLGANLGNEEPREDHDGGTISRDGVHLEEEEEEARSSLNVDHVLGDPGQESPPEAENTQPEEGAEPSNIESHECSVCWSTLDASNRPQQRTTSSCQREVDICRRCIATSIDTQFNHKVWDQIGCPSCNEPLDYHDMQHFADKETFERYGTVIPHCCNSI